MERNRDISFVVLDVGRSPGDGAIGKTPAIGIVSAENIRMGGQTYIALSPLTRESISPAMVTGQVIRVEVLDRLWP